MIDPTSTASIDQVDDLDGVWTDDVILSVPCGRCGAVPGEHCRSGVSRLQSRSHLARWRAWCAQRYRAEIAA